MEKLGDRVVLVFVGNVFGLNGFTASRGRLVNIRDSSLKKHRPLLFGRAANSAGVFTALK